MRFLVVGAGAVGGYFGGRLLEAGRDVTFLLRPPRAAQLAATGLAIRSAHGDVVLPAPPFRLSGQVDEAFDVVVLGCKAQALAQAVEALSPAMGPQSVVLPLLNGMAHLDVLDARFGAQRVLGGTCLISATLDGDGHVAHLNRFHTLMFGERSGAPSERTAAIAAAFEGARFDGRRSDAIGQEMWEKWVFIAAAAGITCLMRASVGDIVAAGGSGLALELLDECATIAGAQGFAPRPRTMERFRGMIADPASTLTASMLRDIGNGSGTEGEHVLGDMLRRAEEGQAPLLAVACTHLRAYEVRRRKQGRPGALPPMLQDGDPAKGRPLEPDLLK